MNTAQTSAELIARAREPLYSCPWRDQLMESLASALETSDLSASQSLRDLAEMRKAYVDLKTWADQAAPVIDMVAKYRASNTDKAQTLALNAINTMYLPKSTP